MAKVEKVNIAVTYGAPKLQGYDIPHDMPLPPPPPQKKITPLWEKNAGLTHP
jgi:hypothetical protein